MKGKDPAHRPYLWGARVMIVALLLVMLLLIRKAWNKKKERDGGGRRSLDRLTCGGLDGAIVRGEGRLAGAGPSIEITPVSVVNWIFLRQGKNGQADLGYRRRQGRDGQELRRRQPRPPSGLARPRGRPRRRRPRRPQPPHPPRHQGLPPRPRRFPDQRRPLPRGGGRRNALPEPAHRQGLGEHPLHRQPQPLPEAPPPPPAPPDRGPERHPRPGDGELVQHPRFLPQRQSRRRRRHAGAHGHREHLPLPEVLHHAGPQALHGPLQDPGPPPEDARPDREELPVALRLLQVPHGERPGLRHHPLPGPARLPALPRHEQDAGRAGRPARPVRRRRRPQVPPHRHEVPRRRSLRRGRPRPRSASLRPFYLDHRDSAAARAIRQMSEELAYSIEFTLRTPPEIRLPDA